MIPEGSVLFKRSGNWMTTLVPWCSVDSRGSSALCMASDSRITWGSEVKRWDAGRKLFACKATADIFGYVGEVFFPSLVLGQITAAADDTSGAMGDLAKL